LDGTVVLSVPLAVAREVSYLIAGATGGPTLSSRWYGDSGYYAGMGSSIRGKGYPVSPSLLGALDAGTSLIEGRSVHGLLLSPTVEGDAMRFF
jgi:hypothetical protein